MSLKRAFLHMLLVACAGVTTLAQVEPVIDNSESTVPYPTGQSVGLVLSGGGAKGIAHIGVIQALEEHNIPIDFVAGTSMGAIVGGLYAIGYTPDEMIDLILSPDFACWSAGRIDPNLTYYFLRQPQTPAFAHMNINVHGTDSVASDNALMPQSLISPLPMNFAFMDLFAAYTAQCGGNFDKLFVPFRCVASDVIHKHKIVCRDGMLSDAIRASMSFPAVFAPIKMNGVDVYDGGIYDNFPVDVMREEFAPSIMIGVDVHSEEPQESNSILSQLENMIIQNNDYDLPADQGIRIHVDVSRYSLLDFDKAKEIYQIGYNRAMEMMDSIEGRVTSRIPHEARQLSRAVFKSATPYVRFDSVNVTGGTPSQNEYLTRIFETSKQHADTFGIEKARLAYYRALTPGKLRNLFPQAYYNDSTGLFLLDLAADVKNNFTLGAGGYLTSSINSMMFVSANYSSLSFSSWSTRLMGWIGQSYMAGQFGADLSLTNTMPSALRLEAVISRQKYYESDRLFFQDNSPSFISDYEGFARLNFAWAMGRRSSAQIGVGGGYARNRYYTDGSEEFQSSNAEETRMKLFEAVARFEYSTLNEASYPTEGSFLNLSAFQTLGKYQHQIKLADGNNPTTDINQHWGQVELRVANYFPMGSKFAFGVNADVLASNRKLLNTYYASIINAPSFTPSASMEDVFNLAYHANSFVDVGIVPIWKPINNAQVRVTANMFMPFQKIEQNEFDNGAHYGAWFSNPEFTAELDLIYTLPFASICGYVNWLSYPADNWNVGLSFGLYFTASKFLR